MRLFIVGQKWIGAALLDQCLADGQTVVGVAAPGPGDRLFEAATAAGLSATSHGRRLHPEAITGAPDLILAAGAHCFIPAQARARARIGTLGYHPSLLPRHRGRDAIRWAIHMGEAVTGGTVYWMDDGADTGPLALQGWCHIRPGDTPAELWRRDLAPMGLRLFREAIALAKAGRLPKVDQDAGLATFEPAFSARPLSAF